MNEPIPPITRTPRPMSPQKSGWPVLIVLILGLGSGMILGRVTAAKPNTSPVSTVQAGRVTGLGQSAPSSISSDVEFKVFWEAWGLLKEKYYEQPIDDKRLFYGAMSGLASAFGDPYTQYFEPKGAEEFQAALAGKFSGIGAEIGPKSGGIVIISPLPDTPAERAGLRAGDFITAVNGTSTEGLNADATAYLIRGDEGTDVTLSMFRPNEGDGESFDVTITRAVIRVAAVRLSWVDDNIAHIEVSSFNDDAREHFEQTIDEVLQKDPKGIILDLRNDPGGYLDIAVSMAGEWVGRDIVLKERRQGEIIEQPRGTGKKRFADIPTVVLVNGGSASAAEIVSGALQDHKAAIIVGEQTFGKGSVQDYVDLSDGSAIKVTIAEWLTPNERTINGTGLKPDIYVERTNDDYENQRDPQLDRAIGILNGTASAEPDGNPKEN